MPSVNLVVGESKKFHQVDQNVLLQSDRGSILHTIASDMDTRDKIYYIKNINEFQFNSIIEYLIWGTISLENEDNIKLLAREAHLLGLKELQVYLNLLMYLYTPRIFNQCFEVNVNPNQTPDNKNHEENKNRKSPVESFIEERDNIHPQWIKGKPHDLPSKYKYNKFSDILGPEYKKITTQKVRKPECYQFQVDVVKKKILYRHHTTYRWESIDLETLEMIDFETYKNTIFDEVTDTDKEPSQSKDIFLQKCFTLMGSVKERGKIRAWRLHLYSKSNLKDLYKWVEALYLFTKAIRKSSKKFGSIVVLPILFNMMEEGALAKKNIAETHIKTKNLTQIAASIDNPTDKRTGTKTETEAGFANRKRIETDQKFHPNWPTRLYISNIFEKADGSDTICFWKKDMDPHVSFDYSAQLNRKYYDLRPFSSHNKSAIHKSTVDKTLGKHHGNMALLEQHPSYSKIIFIPKEEEEKKQNEPNKEIALVFRGADECLKVKTMPHSAPIALSQSLPEPLLEPLLEPLFEPLFEPKAQSLTKSFPESLSQTFTESLPQYSPQNLVKASIEISTKPSKQDSKPHSWTHSTPQAFPKPLPSPFVDMSSITLGAAGENKVDHSTLLDCLSTQKKIPQLSELINDYKKNLIAVHNTDNSFDLDTNFPVFPVFSDPVPSTLPCFESSAPFDTFPSFGYDPQCKSQVSENNAETASTLLFCAPDSNSPFGNFDLTPNTHFDSYTNKNIKQTHSKATTISEVLQINTSQEKQQHEDKEKRQQKQEKEKEKGIKTVSELIMELNMEKKSVELATSLVKPMENLASIKTAEPKKYFSAEHRQNAIIPWGGVQLLPVATKTILFAHKIPQKF